MVLAWCPRTSVSSLSVANSMYDLIIFFPTSLMFPPQIVANRINKVAFVVAVAFYGYSRCTQLLWGAWSIPVLKNLIWSPAESVIAIPALGVQLESHRGLPSLPLFTSRHFIPLAFLQDFVINEGLRRWDVRYYLAAVTKTEDGVTNLHVTYEVCISLLGNDMSQLSTEHFALFSSAARGISPRTPRHVWRYQHIIKHFPTYHITI